MKKIATIIILLISINLYAQENFIKSKSTVQVNLPDFIKYAYGKKMNDLSAEEKKRQPFSDKEHALNFVINLITNTQVSADIKNLWNGILGQKVDAVIFYFQPLNTNQLFGNPEKIASLQKEYQNICTIKNGITEKIGEIDIKINEIEDTVLKNETIAKDPSTINALTVYNLLKQKYQKEHNEKQEIMDSLSKQFEGVFYKFDYLNSVSTLVLQKEGGDWDDYLLNKKNILLVFVGNETLLAKSNIEINLKPTSFQTEISDLFTLAKTLNISIPSGADYLKTSNDCKLPDDSTIEKTGISFIYLNYKKLKSPYEIKVTSPELKEIAVQTVYEKKYIGIRVGIGAQYIERKNFSLNSNHELTIKTDSAQNSEWKSNFALLFEFIPWGRDYNRLEPLWSKNKSTAFAERIGFFGGVKLANDPLEAMFGGISFALTKDVSLGLGMSFFSTPVDQKNLPVGIDASLDYLKKYSQKEYKPRLYFGLMLTPGQVLKTINGKD